MSSLVIGAAETALTIKTGLSDLDKEVSGDLKGRNVTHWSFKLFIAGSIVAVIGAIAAFVLQWNIVGGVGLFLCVTNAFAAFYIKKFSVLKTLEDYTDVLAKRIKLFAEKILELKKINIQLEKVSHGIKKIPKDWQKAIKKGKEELDKKTAELEKVTQKLEFAEKKLQKLAEVTDQLQKETGKLSEEALKFSKENDFFGKKVEDLRGNVDEIGQNHDSLVGMITRLDKENDQTEEIMKTYQRQNETLENLFEVMKEMYVQVKEKMGGLEAEVEELSTVVPRAVESADKVEAVANHFQEIISEMNEKLKEMEKYKKGYSEWKRFSKSKEYKQWKAKETS